MQKLNKKFPGTKVLVADDYPINLELTMDMLELMDCDVDSAEDGVEAVKQCSQTKYDIIFMDVQMPNMDGYEATKEIRNKDNLNSDSIIVAITANAMAGDKKKCIDAGMDDYISKPIKGKNLEEMLSKYLKDKG